MITLISKWKLKNGVPSELLKNLKTVADKVKQSEPDTLMYLVNLPGPRPQKDQTTPACIPLDQQDEVVFMEIYKNAEAFNKHLNGPVFTQFKKENLKYFKHVPGKPDKPLTETQFLNRESAFIRPEAG